MKTFSQKVLFLVNKIPRGQVSTYRLVAAAAGSRLACQAVGKILSKNKLSYCQTAWSKKIPCHRVVKSTGWLGGFQQGEKIKKQLLKKEGIVIKNNKIQNFKNKLFDFHYE